MIDPLEWTTWVVYALTLAVATLVAFKVKRDLGYWPAVNVLAVAHGSRALYFGLADFPLADAAWHAALREPWAALLCNGFVLGGLVWALVIIQRQNRYGRKAVVDIDGIAHPVSSETAHEDVNRAVQRAMEIDAGAPI